MRKLWESYQTRATRRLLDLAPPRIAHGHSWRWNVIVGLFLLLSGTGLGC
ncbi:MAG: hypothetical protein M3P30_08280 [Chloroflexota bacterium]|nr:hypothetical protein [Chloroflexota bacterium]